MADTLRARDEGITTARSSGWPTACSLAPGKAANVIVTTGDVMDARTQVEQVFIDGVAQSLETRHTRLYRQFKDRP